MTRPPLFRDLTLQSAREAARDEHKVLLVDVMGDWCPPCRQMDATTWRAPEVEAWAAEHAIAIQVDSQDPSVAPFNIKAVPTMLLFRDDALVDRVSGGHGATELLAWIERALAGEKEIDRIALGDPNDIHRRLQYARALRELGRHDEAGAELAWAWENALSISPSWIGVRHSFLIAEIADQVDYPLTRDRFEELRDQAEAQLPAADALRDWINLNKALGEPERTLVWFDRVKAELAPSAALLAHPSLFDLLEHSERWADIGLLIESGVQMVEESHALYTKVRESIGEGAPAEMRAYVERAFRARAGVLHRALKAANRTAEADALAARARALEPGAPMDDALAG